MFWIILVLITLLFMFLYDRHKHYQDLSIDGGFQNIYKVLIDYMLKASQGNVTNHGKDYIFIIYRTGSSFTSYHAQLILNTMIIEWKIFTPGFISLSKKWEFSTLKIRQEQMVEVLESDIALVLKPYFEFLNSSENLTLERNTLLENEDKDFQSYTRQETVNILNSRKLITKSGKYQIIVEDVYPIEFESEFTHVVEFKAMTSDQAKNVRKFMEQDLYAKALKEIVNTCLNENKEYIPKKNDLVEVTIKHSVFDSATDFWVTDVSPIISSIPTYTPLNLDPFKYKI